MDVTKFNLDAWRFFMNGYRDPKTRAADREALIERYGRDEYANRMTAMGGVGGDGARECGHRKDGGTYAVVPSSANGSPVDAFLLCKPMAIDKDEYNLSNVGVRLVDIEQDCIKCGGKPSKGAKTCQTCYGTGKETITHVFDIIGQEYYPNIADFMEEARRMGVSRRLELETSKEYARLTSRSRLFLLHHRAIIENPEALLKRMGKTELLRLHRAGCPKRLEEHLIYEKSLKIARVGVIAKNSPGCSALYWNVLEERAEIIPEFDLNPEDDPDTFPEDCERFAERKLASGTYRGYSLPFDVKLKYSLGVFAVFPLGRLEVVNSSGEFDDRVTRASSAKLDVKETDC